MWTDPQIHSIDGEGYGKGNMGREGIEKFLNAHKCNAICKFLNLPQTGKFKEVSGTETVVRPDQGMTTMLDGAAGARIQNERLQLAGKEAELKKEREALEKERRRLYENAGERAKDLEKARWAGCDGRFEHLFARNLNMRCHPWGRTISSPLHSHFFPNFSPSIYL
jgi:hypothetical protein